jgi:hypothetical protein
VADAVAMSQLRGNGRLPGRLQVGGSQSTPLTDLLTTVLDQAGRPWSRCASDLALSTDLDGGENA